MFIVFNLELVVVIRGCYVKLCSTLTQAEI
jgi:hypothetical protein